MKRVSLIAFATTLGALTLSVITASEPLAVGRTNASSRPASKTGATAQTPVRNTFWTLKAAAKSLAYFPAMERAISGTGLAADARQIFADAEVRLTRVGPIRIGMTLEEATDALGLPLIPLGRNVNGECVYYQPDTATQALGLMVVGNRVIRVDVWPGSTLATSSGAQIGTTEAELLDLYPGQIEAAPNPYTQGKFLTFVPQDPELALYRLVFETNAQGQVVQFRTGQFPAVTWPDGCI